jgi:hypothetical protein
MSHLRFWRRIKILPGLHLNVGKKGISFTFGPRGIKFTKGSSGERFSIGLPGSGLSFVKQSIEKKKVIVTDETESQDLEALKEEIKGI